MFNFHLRVLLCVLVFGILVSTIQSQYVDPLPIYDDCTCVDTPYFLQWLQREQSDILIYQKITEPLMVFPEEIKLYAEKIQYAIYNGHIKISNSIQYLKEFTNLNRFDLMISFFLHLATGVCGQIPNEIKAESLKIVNYALEKKYLHLITTPILEINTIQAHQKNFINSHNDYEGHGSNLKEIIYGTSKNNVWNNGQIYNFDDEINENYHHKSHQQINKFDSSNNHQHGSCCNCKNSLLIDYLLGQLMSKNRVEQTNIGSTTDIGSGAIIDLNPGLSFGSSGTNYVRDDSFGTSYIQTSESMIENLISQALISIPQPTCAIDHEYYNLIQNCLQSTNFKTYLKTLNINLHSSEDIWNFLRQYILTIAINDLKLRNAFEYYMSYKQTNFSFANLITLLPTPTNDKEIQWYNMAKNFLSSSEIYSYFQGMNFSNQNLNDIYLLVLQTLANIGGGECWQHYLNQHVGFQCAKVLSTLPQPKMEMEFNYYNTLSNFLNSNECQQYFIGMDFSTMTSEQKLIEILKILYQKNISTILTESCKYYLGLLTSTKYGFNIYDIITILPHSSNEEQTMTKTLENYMFSDEFNQMAASIKSTEGSYTNNNNNNNELLQKILHLISEKSGQQEIKKVANNLYSRVNEITMSNKLVTLLPQPTTDEEKRNFEIVKQFLLSHESAKYLQGIDISLFNDEKFLLDYVMRKIAESQAELNILSAFKYYLQYSEKLAAIDLITKKEIKRHFKLTEIFTDTLMLDTLTIEQKEAFRSFFKYISEIQPDSLNNFDSWDQAKTRGEFMKLLFAHLQQSQTVPDNIKGCISILNPLIQTTGRAALPPHS